MEHGSTLAAARQEGNLEDSSPRKLQTRCTYCWTLRTGFAQDGRFLSYRVFCHHAGCKEWETVHARVTIAPMVQWGTIYSAVMKPGEDWEKFKTGAGDAKWLGLPQQGGILYVFSDRPIEGFSFEASGLGLKEIEEIVKSVPEGKRIRRPHEAPRASVEETEKIAVTPVLDFTLPGVSVTVLEDLCTRAGVAVQRVGHYNDCVESVRPLSTEQATMLSLELLKLKGRLQRENGQYQRRGRGR